jgi:hypothetical protein
LDYCRSYKEIIGDKNMVVVKVIPINKKNPNYELYCKEIDNLASIYHGKDSN